MAEPLTPRHKRNKRLGTITEDVFDVFTQKMADAWENEIPLDIYKDFLSRIGTGIPEKTPVLTHRAQSNWVMNSGGPHTFSISGPPFTPPYRAILTFVDNLKAIDTNVYFSNNVEYIADLEDGSSTQRPQGMVQVTFAEVSTELGGYIDALDRAVGFDDLEYEL